jgi:hypothetical protein
MCQAKQVDRNLSLVDARQHGIICWKWCRKSQNPSAANRRGCGECGDHVCDVQTGDDGTAPCPGFRSNIAHNVRHGVDDELLAIAAPPLPDKNYELNSDTGGLRALHPRA